jgi:hypothetical protein
MNRLALTVAGAAQDLAEATPVSRLTLSVEAGQGT